MQNYNQLPVVHFCHIMYFYDIIHPYEDKDFLMSNWFCKTMSLYL